MNMKGVSYCFKKFVIVIMAVCMTCAVSPWVLQTGYFVSADTLEGLEDLGELDGTTFYVKTEISDWSQLEPLLKSEYGITRIVIDGANGGKITAGDLSKFVKLGKGASLEDIPSVNDSGTLTYPTNVLPDYDPSADDGEHFEEGLKLRFKTNHSLQNSFLWSGLLTFVYPMAGEDEVEPSVRIKHGVTASVGGVKESMLQYSSEDSRVGEIIDEDTIELLYWNGAEECIVYEGALRFIDTVETPIAYDLVYSYEISESFLSTVAAPNAEDILGSARVQVLKNSEPEADVELEIYKDAECTEPAEAWDVDSVEFKAVGTLKTDAYGYAEIANLKAGTYYVKRVSTGEVKPLSLNASDKSVDLSGGEGTTAIVNKEDVVLHPDWTANAKLTMGFTDIESADNSDSKTADNYGGNLFVKSGGTAIAANAEGLTELGGCRVYVDRDGGADETFDSLEDAILYINESLLGIEATEEMTRLHGVGALIDGETGRGHIKIKQKYLDEEMLAELQFSSADPPVEPTPIVEPEEPVEPTPIVEPEEPVEPTPIVEPEEPVEPTPIVEPEEPVEEDPIIEPVDEEENVYDDSVSTADDTEIVRWTIMLIAGILALLLVLFRRKIL